MIRIKNLRHHETQPTPSPPSMPAPISSVSISTRKAPAISLKPKPQRFARSFRRRSKLWAFLSTPRPAEAAALCKSLKLDAAQLHGDETPETVAELARSVPVFKAFRVEPDFRLETLDEYAEAFAFSV